MQDFFTARRAGPCSPTGMAKAAAVI